MKNESNDWRKWLIDDNFGVSLRTISLKILKAVEEGAFLDEAVDSCFSRLKASDTAKGLVYQIVSGVTRQRGYLEWILSRFVEKEAKPEVRRLLSL